MTTDTPSWRWPLPARMLCMAAVLLALAACASTRKPVQKQSAGLMTPIAADYFIPADTFAADGLRATAPPAAPVLQGTSSPNAFVSEVQVYFSAHSATYFRKGGLDGSLNVLLWERFLKKYAFPHRVLDGIDALEAAPPGVLVLPSDVALSDRELAAIQRYRQQGGSVLATWMFATRNEGGSWRGFDAAETLLGIRIRGFTGPHEEDRYLNATGDSLVGHALPACQRIWTERAVGWYPLRVEAPRTAAQWHNWSRTLPGAKPNAAMAFDETALQGGGASRMVYLGWPERLWMGADPRSHEAILYDSITWLLRQPSAYLATWPHPYRSAYVPIVYMADVFNHNDLPFAQALADQGLQATYFLLSHELDKSTPTLAQISAMGHRLAYEGDVCEGFRDLAPAEQETRLDTMLQEIQAQPVKMEQAAGFNAPMDDEDANTRTAVASRPFAYMIASDNGTDTCLPYAAEQSTAAARPSPLLVLPRIHRGAEEMLEDYDEDEALVTQHAELASMANLGGLSISRFANQSLLSADALADLAKAVNAHKPTMWAASASQVALWWHERQRVQVELTGTASDAQLIITIEGDAAVASPMSVWVNLPHPDATLELTPIDDAPSLTVQPDDALRSAVLLSGLGPGRHVWRVDFRRP